MPADQLHRDVDLGLNGADVEDGDDVGVGDPSQRAPLGHQAQPRHGGGLVVALRAQNLEGDLAVELGIVGGVDHPHTARAELLEHDVWTDVGTGLADHVLGLARDGVPAIVGTRLRGERCELLVGALAAVVVAVHVEAV